VSKYDIGTKHLRDIINERLIEIGMSRYALAHSGLVDTSPVTVFRFLSGENDCLSATVSQMLVAVGLSVKVDRGTPPIMRPEGKA